MAIFNKNKIKERKEILFIILSTFITVLMIPLVKPVALFMKTNPLFIIFSFLFTAIILLFADKLLKKETSTSETIVLKSSAFAGLIQGLAILPGISRSGSTIFALLFTGIKGEKAAEFSFMLAIPAIAGAALLEFDMESVQMIGFLPMTAGFIASLISSLLSLRLLILLIQKTILKPFAFYLFTLAAILSIIFFIL